MTALPDGWRWLSLADVAAGGLFTDGDWVESKDQDPGGSVRLTQLADVGVGVFRSRSNRWLREDQAAGLGCTFLEPDDVLIARMPEPIGRACLVPPAIGRAVTAVDVAVLRVRRPDVDPRYITWALNSPLIHQRIARLQSGTTRKRVSRKNLATVELPVPSMGEQRRIVEIVEDQLSRLDAAHALHARARQRLQLLPPSSMQAALTGLHVPEVTLGELSRKSEYGTSVKCVPGGPGVPVVRIPNLKDGGVDLADEKRVALPGIDLSSLMLHEGDLLIIRTNGSRDLIGRSAVVREPIEASFASYIIRFQLRADLVVPEWVHLTLEMPTGRRQLETLAASSAGQFNLSLSKLSQVRIPLPGLSEQQRLSAAAATLRDAVGKQFAEIDLQLRRAGALRRELLTSAFSGRFTRSAFDVDRIEEMAPA